MQAHYVLVCQKISKKGVSGKRNVYTRIHAFLLLVLIPPRECGHTPTQKIIRLSDFD